MKTPPRMILQPWFTHGFAAVLAGLIAWKWNQPTALPSAASEESNHGATQSGDVAADLLKELVAEAKKGAPQPDEFDAASFERLYSATEISSDPKKKFLALMEQIEFLSEDATTTSLREALAKKTELALVYLKQWLLNNPEESLRWMAEFTKDTDNERVRYSMQAWDGVMVILSDFMKGQGLREFAELCHKTGMRNPAAFVMLRDLSERGDLADYQYLNNLFGDWKDFDPGYAIGSHWDVEKRDELLAGLRLEHRAAAIEQLATRMDGDAAYAWLHENISSGAWDEKILSSLKESRLGSHYQSIENLNLDQRVAIMELLGNLGQTTVKRAKDELIFQSMTKQFVMGDDDLLYQFRNGQISGPDAYQHMLEICVDPGDYTGEFRSQAFRTLAQENLPAALTMLEGMSPHDIELQKTYAARWWFRNSSPDDFFELTASINTQGDRDMERLLFESWQEKTSSYLNYMGSSYFAWLKNQPDGISRDRALDAFIRNAGSSLNTQVKEAQELRK